MYHPPTPETTNKELSAASATSSWLGRLEITYTHRQQTTQIQRDRIQAPLKIQRPFYPEGPQVCHTVALHTAGGMVGGDRLSQELTLQPQAQVLFTTAAASKVYRSEEAIARHQVHLHVQADAHLEWLPQETIVFNGARYHQDMRVALAPEATWLGWEITRFGRSARGERFERGTWRSRIEVWQGETPLWIDRQYLIGGSPMLDSLSGLAGQSVIATLVWLGKPVSADVVAKSRNLYSFPEGEIGVTRLPMGMLCRYRGSSTVDARQWLVAVWGWLRQTFRQRPVCYPRVWV
ncbi:urease accessory protein UreD [Geitlerinema sp. PCC 9228]|uniref:urease accessory protein UreD n=1 Tax=Geitlerinema sp. PCC 9228 TaxID=111611 RepID=UPI0009FE9A73|nr:urease accessory protein UreD [Geitlerinema sp. PCC 9228]